MLEELTDPPDPGAEKYTGATAKKFKQNEEEKVTQDSTTNNSGHQNGARNNYSFEYTRTDMAPYRIYFELRKETTTEKINKFTLGAALLELGMKPYITDMKYVGKHKIMVFVSSYLKANLLVETINAGDSIYRAYVPKHVVCITGVVAGIPANIDVEQIKEEIQCEVPIIDVVRMTRYEEGVGKVPISRISVTFRAHELPRNVRMFCCSSNVQPFRPKVVICMKCLRFGHRTDNCKGARRCQRCSQRHDDEEEFRNCPKTLYCVHCKSTEHNSVDQACPERKRQHNIKVLMSRKNLTYSEAREQIPQVQNMYEPLLHAEEFPATSDTFAQMTKGQFTWKNPLREEWIKTNQERKAVQAAVKTYKEDPKKKPQKRVFKQQQQTQTAAQATTEERNNIVATTSDARNGMGLNNIYKTTEKERLEAEFKKREERLMANFRQMQATENRKQQELMMSFYTEFIDNLGQNEDAKETFRRCTTKHFNLTNTIIQKRSPQDHLPDIPDGDENL